MELVDQIKQLAKRIESLKETIQTEEATKMSLVVPFFQMLGYDVFNPQEFVPEYTADVGIKKGEKVDYAIIKDGKPEQDGQRSFPDNQHSQHPGKPGY